MFPVTPVEDQQKPDLKLIIHRLLHQLIDRERERPGWYGNPLPTAWIGLALQAHDDRQNEVQEIAKELHTWFENTDVADEFEVAALGLIAQFYSQYDRGRPIYQDIKEQFFTTLDKEKERRETTEGSTDAPRFQYFNSYVYLYCALIGIKAYDRLDDYRQFLKAEVEAQRQQTWTEYNRMAFVETVALEANDYDPGECRNVLQKMRTVDEEDLTDHELIPLLWFFQEQQDEIRQALPKEQFAHDFLDEVRQRLWHRLWTELPFERYLTDDIDYEFTPDIQQLALLDRLLGRLDNPIFVFSEQQLREHEEGIAEEKDEIISVNRIRKLWAYILISFLAAFIAIDVIVAFPPPVEAISTVWMVQGIVVLVLMHFEWRLEDLAKEHGWTERVDGRE